MSRLCVLLCTRDILNYLDILTYLVTGFDDSEGLKSGHNQYYHETVFCLYSL